MRTFERYVYRILIPVVVVSLIGVGVRYALLRDFAKENVRFADTTVQEAHEASDKEYSEKNRDEIVSTLRSSKAALDRLREQGDRAFSEGEAEIALDRASHLKASIENLATASVENWTARREDALERLAAYARALEASE